MQRAKDKCNVCNHKGIKSFTYVNTYYCENCKDYFGEQAEVANEPLLIGD